MKNGFLPPRAIASPLDPAGWDAAGGVPMMLNGLGGRPAPESGTLIQFAYDAKFLHLRAQCDDPNPALLPDIPVDSPDFWRQDHIEFRFIPDHAKPDEQIQILVAADGRCWDSHGLWKQNAGLASRGTRSDYGWEIHLSVPLAKTGRFVKGIVARTRWEDGVAHILCSSAPERGFAHFERFGEILLSGNPGPVRLREVMPFGAALVNASPEPVSGHLRVTTQRGTETAWTHLAPCVLEPGENHLPLALGSGRNLFTRHRFDFVTPSRTWELGAVSFRSPFPPLTVRESELAHPYLLFDEAGLGEIHAKLDHPPFSELRQSSVASEQDLTGSDIPGPDDHVSLRITKDSMLWFRVAKETMIRDGEGGKNPAAQWLWELQSEKAHKAWHGIYTAVTPSDEDLAVLCAELDGLLSRRDFYNAAAFAQVGIPYEAGEMLGRGIDSLTDAEVFRLNRILLQSAVECILCFRMDLVGRPGACFAQWLVTPDPRLIATATKAVRAALAHTIMDHQVHLHEGVAAGGVALAYDAFHPHLSEDDRLAWQQLLERFLHLYISTARRISWTVTAIPNANPVGNGGCGLAALALLREAPALAREALQYQREYIWHWLDYCEGEDGGNTEGAQYWQYGMENFLRFATALERVAGSDDGLLAHPAIRNATNMIRVSLCNDGALHGVNDTLPTAVGGALGWFAAGRFNDNLGLWYGDHSRRWFSAPNKASSFGEGNRIFRYGASASDMLLYRPVAPEQKAQPPLPVAFALKSIHYGIIRSGTNYDCVLDAGLKGSRPPFTHHNQADTGSFFVDVRGERLLIDPGYYKDTPKDHCLPLIDGKGPPYPDTWTGKIIACESRGDLRYLAVDSTAAYGVAATRVVRHLVMAGEEGLILLDDIVTKGKVTAQYQCGGVTSDLGAQRSVMIRGHRAALRLEILTRPDLRLVLHLERSLKDTHWGYAFADCLLFPVTGDYAADEADPLITVILDATPANPGPSSLTSQGRELTVKLPSGRLLTFLRHDTGWAVNLPP